TDADDRWRQTASERRFLPGLRIDARDLADSAFGDVQRTIWADGAAHGTLQARNQLSGGGPPEWWHGARRNQSDREHHHNDRSAEVEFCHAHRRFQSEREIVLFIHDSISFFCCGLL